MSYEEVITNDYPASFIILHKSGSKVPVRDLVKRGSKMMMSYYSKYCREEEILEFISAINLKKTLLDSAEESWGSQTLDREIPIELAVRLSSESFTECMSRDDSYSLQCLLEAYPEGVNEKDTDGNTPLIIACLKGSHSCVDLLIRKGARFELNAVGDGPIESCLYGDHPKVECVKFLVGGGCPLFSDVAIKYCIIKDSHWIFGYIFPIYRGGIGWDLVHQALKSGSFGCLSVLSQRGMLTSYASQIFDFFSRACDVKDIRMIIFLISTRIVSPFRSISAQRGCLLDFMILSGWVEGMRLLLNFYSRHETIPFEGPFMFAFLRKRLPQDQHMPRPKLPTDVKEFSVMAADLSFSADISPLSEREVRVKDCMTMLLSHFNFTTVFDKRIKSNILFMKTGRAVMQSVTGLLTDYLELINLSYMGKRFISVSPKLSPFHIPSCTRITLDHETVQLALDTGSPLSSEMLSLLYSKGALLKAKSTLEVSSECGACGGVKVDGMILSCKHSFCKDCIIRVSKCPVCKKGISVKDITSE
jgi:hypothetical protein